VITGLFLQEWEPLDTSTGLASTREPQFQLQRITGHIHRHCSTTSTHRERLATRVGGLALLAHRNYYQWPVWDWDASKILPDVVPDSFPPSLLSLQFQLHGITRPDDSVFRSTIHSGLASKLPSVLFIIVPLSERQGGPRGGGRMEEEMVRDLVKWVGMGGLRGE